MEKDLPVSRSRGGTHRKRKSNRATLVSERHSRAEVVYISRTKLLSLTGVSIVLRSIHRLDHLTAKITSARRYPFLSAKSPRGLVPTGERDGLMLARMAHQLPDRTFFNVRNSSAVISSRSTWCPSLLQILSSGAYCSLSTLIIGIASQHF